MMLIATLLVYMVVVVIIAAITNKAIEYLIKKGIWPEK